jgi:hypothetical protein
MVGSGSYQLSDGSTGSLSFSEIGASSSVQSKQAVQAPKTDFLYSSPKKAEASISAASAGDVIAASRISYIRILLQGVEPRRHLGCTNGADGWCGRSLLHSPS